MPLVSTDIASSSRRRRYAGWLVAPMALAMVVLGIVLRDAGSGSAPGPDGLRAQLATRVTAILERSSPVEHHNHGHDFQEKGAIVCAVDVFGYDPPNATTMAKVETVYVHHLCAITGTGGAWNTSVRAAGPLVARLSDPTVVRVVQSGAGFAERIQSMIPQAYQQRALGRFSDQAALAEVRKRFDAAVANRR
jgi:hypothetical protein